MALLRAIPGHKCIVSVVSEPHTVAVLMALCAGGSTMDGSTSAKGVFMHSDLCYAPHIHTHHSLLMWIPAVSLVYTGTVNRNSKLPKIQRGVNLT